MEDVLAIIRAESAARGTSMQRQLYDIVLAHATHHRRQAALASMEDRLRGRPAVTEQDRDAVLAATKDEREITPAGATEEPAP